jgi:Xaa-Pro aminopeptidase
VPDISELKCVICEKNLTQDEIAEHKEACTECEDALGEAADTFERGDAKEEDITPEMQSAIKRHEARKAYMAKYNSRPGVKEARKKYMKERAARDRELIRKARQLGIE